MSGTGIKTANLEWEKPRMINKYDVMCNVTAREMSVTSIPSEYSTDGMTNYLGPTGGVEVDNKIKSLAENITRNAKTDFERLSAISHWVHGYIKYDKSMTDRYLTTSQILEEKRGVCVEYATLFSSLARSLGYPTRFVGGLAYTNNSFRGHMWVEVYIGRWIPFDPTWDIGGKVDAGHIVFFKSENRDVKSQIKYKSNGGIIEWETNEFGDVVIHSYTEDKSQIKITNPIVEMPIGGKGFILTRIPANGYEYGSIISAPCNKKFKVIDMKKESMYISQPGENPVIIWEINSSNELDPDYIYQCPISFKGFNLNGETSIKIDKREFPKFSVGVSDENPNVGEEIYATIKSEDPMKFTGIMGNQIDTGYGRTVILRFNIKKNIPNNITITSQYGGLASKVITPRTEGIIKSVEYPKVVTVEEDTQLIVSTQNVTDGFIELSTDSLRIRKNTNGTTKFNLHLGKTGEHSIIIKLVSKSGEDTKTVHILVVEKPRISISEFRVNKNNVVIVFNISGEPKDVRMFLDGKEESFRQMLMKNMGDGFHYMIVTWKDQTGKSYSLAKSFTIGSEMRELDLFILMFTLLLAMAIVLLIIAILLVMGSIKRRAQ